MMNRVHNFWEDTFCSKLSTFEEWMMYLSVRCQDSNFKRGSIEQL